MTWGAKSVRGKFKRTAKIAISLFYFAIGEAARFLLRMEGRSPAPKLVVLYYHGIPSAHRANFVRQLDSIRRRAHVFPASHRDTVPSGKPNVAITFDDAYVSVAENALPELAARGFHSTIFVPVGALGSYPSWSMEDGSPDACERVMSAEQIAKLPSSLVTVGSHSRTHPRLPRLSFTDAWAEIDGSRTNLAELTTRDIRLFAFPYGDHNSSIVEMCETAGYHFVFSTAPNPVATTSIEFVRGRVKVDPWDSPLEFFLKYRGAYSWVPYASSLKRMLRECRKTRSPFRHFPTDKQPERI